MGTRWLLRLKNNVGVLALIYFQYDGHIDSEPLKLFQWILKHQFVDYNEAYSFDTNVISDFKSLCMKIVYHVAKHSLSADLQPTNIGIGELGVDYEYELEYSKEIKKVGNMELKIYQNNSEEKGKFLGSTPLKNYFEWTEFYLKQEKKKNNSNSSSGSSDSSDQETNKTPKSSKQIID